MSAYGSNSTTSYCRKIAEDGKAATAWLQSVWSAKDVVGYARFLVDACSGAYFIDHEISTRTPKARIDIHNIDRRPVFLSSRHPRSHGQIESAKYYYNESTMEHL
jgi:hypothetical protein